MHVYSITHFFCELLLLTFSLSVYVSKRSRSSSLRCRTISFSRTVITLPTQSTAKSSVKH